MSNNIRWPSLHVLNLQYGHSCGLSMYLLDEKYLMGTGRCRPTMGSEERFDSSRIETKDSLNLESISFYVRDLLVSKH